MPLVARPPARRVAPVWVNAVPGAIEQILDNTLDNALKASPPNTTIVVEVTASREQTRMTITDQGSGLDDRAKANAMERFWRADPTMPGTGLGLAIARRLAEASLGSLELLDGPSGGLAVVIRLPTCVERSGE